MDEDKVVVGVPVVVEVSVGCLLPLTVIVTAVVVVFSIETKTEIIF